MRTPRFATVILVTMLLASCESEGGSEPPAAAESITVTTNTTTAPTTNAPTTTIVTDLTATDASALGTTVVEGLRYHAAGVPFADKPGAIDVVAPTEDGGPWPTIVVFHGNPRMTSKAWHRYDAQLLAEQGRVVFIANWGHEDTGASDVLSQQDRWNLGNREVACALVYAYAQTADFGNGMSTSISLPISNSAGTSPMESST